MTREKISHLDVKIVNKKDARKKRTTLGIPTWSPTVVLTEPEHA